MPKTNPDLKPPVIPLPTPTPSREPVVSVAIATRRTCRTFAARTLRPEEISALCFAAQGITDQEDDLRATPSAGAIYPMTVFTVTAEAVHEYMPRSHALRVTTKGDHRPALQAVSCDQACVGDAPLSLVLAVHVPTMARKYGDDAERFCLLEAGHAAQNILLQATAIGLGGVPIGAYREEDVTRVLRLPRRLRPVYFVSIGAPIDG